MSRSIDRYLSWASRRLHQSGLSDSLREARYLLEASGLPRLQQLSEPKQLMPPNIAKEFLRLVRRRCRREPLSHIRGTKEFWSMSFFTSRSVLDPRPETETLIELLLEYRSDVNPSGRIGDLGTGSGCLLLGILKEFPQAWGMGIDLSLEALKIARRNADKLDLWDRAAFCQGYWGASLTDESFDILVSNPPYIKEGVDLPPEVASFDPPLALYGGRDGLACYRALLPDVARLLKNNGIAILEIGQGQRSAIEAIAAENALYCSVAKADLSGIERALLLRKR